MDNYYVNMSGTWEVEYKVPANSYEEAVDLLLDAMENGSAFGDPFIISEYDKMTDAMTIDDIDGIEPNDVQDVWDRAKGYSSNNWF